MMWDYLQNFVVDFPTENILGGLFTHYQHNHTDLKQMLVQQWDVNNIV